MLEQTLKRYITLPGVLEQIEVDMQDAISAIKARMFEVCVEELYKQGNRVWLGRIRDAIKELGA